MQEALDIQDALDTLDLPPFITKNEIKKRYRELAKKYHPDISKDSLEMEKINKAYKTLIDYIDNFRYSFDEDELLKQLPNINHNRKFNL